MSVAALGAYHLEPFAVANCKIVAKHGIEGDVVPAVQAELLAGKSPLQNISKNFRLVVGLFLFIGHGYSPLEATKPTGSMVGDRVGSCLLIGFN